MSASVSDRPRSTYRVEISSEATVRQPSSFKITALNDDGSQAAEGGEQFFVAVRGVSNTRGRVADNRDGTYTVTWHPALSGPYSISVSNFGIPLPGSPFSLMATTPEPCPSMCVLSGQGLTSGVARETNTFQISFRDKLGSVTRAVDLDVFVEPIPPGSPRMLGDHAMSDDTKSLPRYFPEPGREDFVSPAKGAHTGSGSGRVSSGASSLRDGGYALEVSASQEAGANGYAVTRTSAERLDPHAECQTRHRRVRVRVGAKPLVVRAQCELDSEQIGELLPGAIVTVIEERILPGNVRACVSLDYLSKQEGGCLKTERASTSRSSSTFRVCPTSREEPVGSPLREQTSSGVASSRLIRAALEGKSPHGSFGSMSKQSWRKSSSRGIERAANGSESYRSNSDGSCLSAKQLDSKPVDDGTAKARGDNHTAESEDLSPIRLVSSVLERIAEAGPDEATLFQEANHESFRARTERSDHATAMNGSEITPVHPRRTDISGHERVQQRLGLKLDVEATLDAADDTVSSSSHSEQRDNEFFHETSHLDDEIPDSLQTGWITLVKNGKKLVSSRLRLEPCRRSQYSEQWERRASTDKMAAYREKEVYGVDRKINAAERAAAQAVRTIGVTRNFTLELSSAERTSDPAAFAFGGVYPGTLHAHGKLFENHRGSFSIGIAGMYLLHVRLRKQAISLPGSPFSLQIRPGSAFALSTRVPTEIVGEVGGKCSLTIATGDKMNNPCASGGTTIVSHALLESSNILTESTDHGDGTYTLKWTSTKTGVFQVAIKIGDMHVVNSPTRIKLTSTVPDISKCIIEGDGTKQVIKGETGSFLIRFFDEFSNATIQTSEFRSDFIPGMLLSAPGASAAKGRHDFEGEWVEGVIPEYMEYKMSYTASLASGAYALHVWVERNGVRVPFPGSPFMTSIISSANDAVISHEIVDATGITSGDYKVARGVFDEIQKMWGDCTIDAFASAATSLLPRWWAKDNVSGSEGSNALKQQWKLGERIWAHPPPKLLDAVSRHLQKPERQAEVIICTPFRPSNDWFFRIMGLSDANKKYMAGKLQPVAEDAPSRLSEWPIMLFHIPPRTPESISPKLSRSKTSPAPLSAALDAMPEDVKIDDEDDNGDVAASPGMARAASSIASQLLHAGASALEASVNVMERTTGWDIDGDGDVGLAGHGSNLSRC